MSSNSEFSTYISSVGSVGTFPRPDQRVVTIVDHAPLTPRDLSVPLRATTAMMRTTGATRAQLKFPGTPELANHPIITPFVEGVLDASNGVQRGVIFTAHNRGERNRPPESWNEVREIWQRPLTVSPVERIQQVIGAGNTFTTVFNDADIPRMAEIWGSFGWDEVGVQEWLGDYRRGVGGWACGVRGNDGQINSLAKAELIALGDMGLVESTEWAADPANRQHGLSSAAAIALNTRILCQPPNTHGYTIYAEANMKREKPGHRVARNAGFHACADFRSKRSNGVLRRHVSVDGELCDFLMVQLTPDAIRAHYPPDVLRYINSQFTL